MAGLTVVRWLLMVLDPGPALLVPIQLLQGCGMGVVAGLMLFIAQRAPAHLMATAQGLYAVILGVVAALVVAGSGFLWQALGPRAYLAMALITVAGMVMVASQLAGLRREAALAVTDSSGVNAGHDPPRRARPRSGPADPLRPLSLRPRHHCPEDEVLRGLLRLPRMPRRPGRTACGAGLAERRMGSAGHPLRRPAGPSSASPLYMACDNRCSGLRLPGSTPAAGPTITCISKRFNRPARPICSVR